MNLASSSSVVRAGRLTRTLIGNGGAPAEYGPADGANRVYAAIAPVDESAPSVPAPVRGEEARALLEPPIDLDSWDLLLDWGIEVCQARAAFVVDSQGFVIASRGNVPADGFAGVGAETCYLMEEIEGIDSEAGPLRAIEMTFDNRTILGFRMILSDGAATAVGFIISQRPTSAAMEVLVEHLTNWLAKRL